VFVFIVLGTKSTRIVNAAKDWCTTVKVKFVLYWEIATAMRRINKTTLQISDNIFKKTNNTLISHLRCYPSYLRFRVLVCVQNINLSLNVLLIETLQVDQNLIFGV
jgi:hypothetical protein